MSFLKSEKGIAMPLILMVLVVLTLLGTALWQYSVSEVRQATRAESKARAYYIARAGAESLARYIMQDPEQVDAILDDGSESVSDLIDFETEMLGQAGEMEVTLRRLDHNRLEISGTGQSGGVRQSATVVLEQLPFPGDAAVVTTGAGLVNFHKNMSLEGSVIAGGEVNLPTDFDTSRFSITENYPFTDDTFARVVIPVIQPDQTFHNISIRNRTENIAAGRSVVYNRIDIENRGILQLNPGSRVEVGTLTLRSGGTLDIITAAGPPVIMVVNQMDLKGVLRVTGTGSAEIYVRTLADIVTSNANVYSAERLTFFLAEGCTVTIQANAAFDALIYGPYGTEVILQANPTFRGAMIVGSLRGNGTFIGQAGGLIEFAVGFGDHGIKPVVNMLYWRP